MVQLSTFVVAVTATFATFASAAPTPHEERSTRCSNPLVRKEWRQLNVLEKSNYLLSMKCMTLKPSKLNSIFPAAKTRWDDFISIHQVVTPQIHYVGQFLPWHRLFLHEFEQAIRRECLYFGALPYWDMSLDSQSIADSPLVSSVLGFGGDGAPLNGQSNGGCIQDGLFKNTKIHIAPQSDQSTGTERCIKRAFNQVVATAWWTPQRVANVLALSSYETFAVALEGDIIYPNLLAQLGIHNAGHGAIGGDMTDMYTSPLDPLFYLNHANVDRIWAQWQAQNPTSRQFDVGNPIAPRPNPTLVWPNPPAGNVTLDFPLSVNGRNVEVGQVMDTRGSSAPGRPNGILCYTYEI